MNPSASSSQTSKTSLSLRRNCRSCSWSGTFPSIAELLGIFFFLLKNVCDGRHHHRRLLLHPVLRSPPPNRLLLMLLPWHKQRRVLKKREKWRKRPMINDWGTRHCVTSRQLINNPGVLPLSAVFKDAVEPSSTKKENIVHTMQGMTSKIIMVGTGRIQDYDLKQCISFLKIHSSWLHSDAIKHSMKQHSYISS